MEQNEKRCFNVVSGRMNGQAISKHVKQHDYINACLYKCFGEREGKGRGERKKKRKKEENSWRILLLTRDVEAVDFSAASTASASASIL